MDDSRAGGNAGPSSSVEAGLAECFRTFAALPGAVVDERDDVLAVRTDLPLTFLNGVPRTSFGADAEDRVRETVAWFRDRRTPFRWWLTPSVRPPHLVDILAANGLRHFYFATGMVADISNGGPAREVPGLEIIQAGDPRTLATWVEVFAQGFSMPDRAKAVWLGVYSQLDTWHHFLGILDGKPVATTSLCLGGEIGGIYHVVTLPEARGRGVGAAITAAALRRAASAGCRVAALQSSEMAVSVYRSLGFEVCCQLELYDWKPAER
jgi:GNAT superfamily N-acetyltransferase